MSQNQCAHGTRQWHCARLPNSPYIRISGGLFARPSLSPSCANAVGEYKQGLPHPFPPSLFGLGPAISGSGGLRVQARSASFYPTRRLSPPGQRFQLRSPPLHLLPPPSPLSLLPSPSPFKQSPLPRPYLLQQRLAVWAFIMRLPATYCRASTNLFPRC